MAKERKCARCATSIPAGFDFCGKCGAPIDAPPVDSKRGGRGRDAPAPRPSRTVGWGQKALGVVLMLGAVVVFNEGRHARLGGPAASFFGALAAVGVGIYGGRLFVKGKRRTAPTVEEKLAADPRPPVLYLRAFGDDEAASAQYGGTSYPFPLALNTEEEQLARVFDPVGPMVGLGRPGSSMPHLGAAREWVTDEEWKVRITERMDQAALVLLRLAETEGVWWELAKSRQRLTLDRLVLVVPFGRSEYERLRPRLEELLELRLPDFIEGGATSTIRGLVMFDRTGNGRFLPIEGSWIRTSTFNPIASELQNSVAPLFEQLGVEWDRPGPSPLRMWVGFLIVISIIGLVVSAILMATGVRF